jgi:hypothetical protein
MGELTFIKDGFATTIHDNGDMTVVKMDQCDQCHNWVSSSGGLQVRDVGQEVVIWLCAECRA